MRDLVHVSTHPLVRDKVTRLRDRTTGPKEFRELVADLARLLFVEASADLHAAAHTVQSPLAECGGHRLSERLGLFPILRAGLGMADAILQLVPDAHVWHLGLYRDHQTLKPVTYYNKLPPTSELDVAVVLDPMLATGGSAAAVIEILKQRAVGRVKFIGLIAAPEGVRNLRERFPDVPLHLGALDSHLNEVGYIVPGLGDAGDRQFATG
ncbi:MAG: uracil phosphoribosyltransferase [Gemmataceae bacterium]